MSSPSTEHKGTFVIVPPTTAANLSLTETKTTKCGGRTWLWIGIGTLGALSLGGVAVAIYGFMAANTVLGAAGTVTAVGTAAPAACFWRNMPDKDFENNVKDLTAQVDKLGKEKEVEKKIKEELESRITELGRIIETTKKQFNEAEGKWTTSVSELKAVETQLAETTARLANIQDLYAKYKQATEVVQQSLEELSSLDPKLGEQILKIKTLVQTVDKGREETKQIVINVQSEASRTATQAALLETQLNTINLSIRALLEPMRENFRHKALLQEQIETLRKTNTELSEELAKVKSTKSLEETVSRAEETVALLSEITALENSAG